MKKRMLLMLMVVLLCVCACNKDGQEEYLSPRQLANQQSETILRGIINEDVESIKELFCPYVKENCFGLENQIAGMFEFIDGEIVSYDEPDGYRSSYETNEDGAIEESISGKVANIKTSNGMNYYIIHGAHRVDKQHPEYVGVTDMTVLREDMYNPESGYPEDAKYEISCPEMWEQ